MRTSRRQTRASGKAGQPHVTSVRYENVGRCFILDCDEALPIIISHLGGKGLAALASSCRILRDLVE
jgi:hypothetical protein